MKKKTCLLAILVLMFLSIVPSLAIQYTEDGGMVVNGDGTDDFSSMQTADPNAKYTVIITPSPHNTQTEENNGDPNATRPPYVESDVIPFWVVQDDGEIVPVTLLHLGTVFSKVQIGKESKWIDTGSLLYSVSDRVNDLRAYAVVNAPKSGKITLYKSSSLKWNIVNLLSTNRLCLVLDIGRGFTKVWCDGDIGYVYTSALTFIPAKPRAYKTALLSYHGKTNSRNTVNVRQKVNGRILGDISCGTPLVVFTDSSDGWAEVEVNGWHCFLANSFITYDDTALPAPSLLNSMADDS